MEIIYSSLIICTSVILLFVLAYFFFWRPTYIEEIIRTTNVMDRESIIGHVYYIKRIYSNGKIKHIRKEWIT